jgi:capsid assembly protease
MPKRISKPKSYRAIVRSVHETPWAILPEKFDTICEFLRLRGEGQVFTAEEIKSRIGTKPKPAAGNGQVSVLNVFGVVAQRLSMMEEISGGISTEQIAKAFDLALADGNVGTIILRIDSPGGSVFGVQELAAKIFAARKMKRIIAVVDSMACSAAYWIASACEEIVIAPSGMTGSIGVLMAHRSVAGWEDKKGLKTTIARLPEFKAEGAEGETLSAAAIEHRNRMVATYYESFVAAVSQYRGVSAAKVKSDYGQGRVLLAQEAKAAGVVDRIATFESVLSELGVGTQASTASAKKPAFDLKGINMNVKIFGALVRLGMCDITASDAEAQAALQKYLAATGLEIIGLQAEAADEKILGSLNETIKTRTAKPIQGSIALTARPLVHNDARATSIMKAVQISMIAGDAKLAFAQELIAAKDADGNPISVDAAIAKIEAKAAQSQTPIGPTVIIGGESARDKLHAQARDSILARHFNGNAPAKIFDRFSGEYVAYSPVRTQRRLSSLQGIARECLAVAGFDRLALENAPNLAIARLICGADPYSFGIRGDAGGSYNASGMFSNILLDSANVSLRRSYDDARTTFQVWAKQGDSLRDFKPQHRVIAGELGDPKAIPENGEFEETTMLDSKEALELTVWGDVFSISFQSIVNDQLNAFMEAAPKQGRSMKRKQNRLTYGVLKNNPKLADEITLFHASARTDGGHANLTNGAGAPSAATLNLLAAKMAEQKGLGDESAALNIQPRYLLCGPRLQGTVLELLGSTANPNAAHSGVKNVWFNGLEPVFEAELGASAGGSDTAWYLTADSNEVDTVEYAYLEGLETPVIEMQATFDHLGFRQRMYQAFVTKALDFRGMQKHNGA